MLGTEVSRAELGEWNGIGNCCDSVGGLLIR